jgi:hypothetical protein
VVRPPVGTFYDPDVIVDFSEDTTYIVAVVVAVA